jgi:hypothetical protein
MLGAPVLPLLLARSLPLLFNISLRPESLLPSHGVAASGLSTHCAIFLLAATRRCMARISVPSWGFTLSRPLPVIALVGFYPANKLIGRRLIYKRLATLFFRTHWVLSPISRGYPHLTGRFLRVTHSSAMEKPLLEFP